MKKALLLFAITSFIVSMSLAVFGQENKKAAKARKNVAEAQKDEAAAKKDLREARIDSTEDYRQFKREAEQEIMENQKKIAELKAKKWNGTEAENKKYQNKVVILENKNNKLRKEIEGSGNVKKDKWASFKKEFKHDMNELGHAIKDIGVKNTK